MRARYNRVYTYLPRQDSKGVGIADLRRSCVGQPEAFIVHQFRGGAVEELINVHHRCVGQKKGYSKTSEVCAPASINENIRLGGGCEKVRLERWRNCLTIFTFLMDYIPVV